MDKVNRRSAAAVGEISIALNENVPMLLDIWTLGPWLVAVSERLTRCDLDGRSTLLGCRL